MRERVKLWIRHVPEAREYMRERVKLWIRYVPEAREYMRERVKLWIRYVPEASKHMRKEKKDEISMCQRQVNTCEKGKKMKWVCARGK